MDNLQEQLRIEREKVVRLESVYDRCQINNRHTKQCHSPKHTQVNNSNNSVTAASEEFQRRLEEETSRAGEMETQIDEMHQKEAQLREQAAQLMRSMEEDAEKSKQLAEERDQVRRWCVFFLNAFLLISFFLSARRFTKAC